MATLTQVKEANPQWFTRGNKRFFGDVSYRVQHGKVSGAPFLLRSTYAWTDMFGRKRTLHYRINPLHPDTREIQPLIDETFLNIWAAKAWLQEH
ncbi:hypothetical protein LCGC14_1627010 [marine sediment metagenome]|uniref:Uncharacterized protein n=1 Tax=marine sediment metagenome TaxID=412755 RepID=A0A0F9KJD1_9ZZZZ